MANVANRANGANGANGIAIITPLSQKYLCFNSSQVRKRARSQRDVGQQFRTSRHENSVPTQCAGLWESS